MSNETILNPDNYINGATQNPDFTPAYEKKILKLFNYEIPIKLLNNFYSKIKIK